MMEAAVMMGGAGIPSTNIENHVLTAIPEDGIRSVDVVNHILSLSGASDATPRLDSPNLGDLDFLCSVGLI